MEPSRIDVNQMRLRVARGEQSLKAMCLACILAMPEQESSVIAIEDRLWQFGEPLRPQAKAAPPHRYDFRIGINGLCARSNHPSCHPCACTFSLAARRRIKSDTRTSLSA